MVLVEEFGGGVDAVVFDLVEGVLDEDVASCGAFVAFVPAEFAEGLADAFLGEGSSVVEADDVDDVGGGEEFGYFDGVAVGVVVVGVGEFAFGVGLAFFDEVALGVDLSVASLWLWAEVS